MALNLLGINVDSDLFYMILFNFCAINLKAGSPGSETIPTSKKPSSYEGHDPGIEDLRTHELLPWHSRLTNIYL